MNFNKLLKSLFGDKSSRDMKLIQPLVEKVKAVSPQIEQLDNDALRQRTKELQKQVQHSAKEQKARIEELKATIEGTPIDERADIFAQIDKIEKEVLEIYEDALNEVMPEVFAIVKETARRFAENEETVVTATDFDRELAGDPKKDFITIDGDKAIYHNHWTAGGNDLKWEMIHYDVQLFGGVVLHQGKIAEMATGEGKTLVATLPVFLNALTGNGVHVVTVNDYLAKRDSEWMGPLYMFHGLSVDCIDKHQPNSEERRKAYQADITFGTNNEFGFDYLRDNMAISPADLVQRAHNYAIVDEVDSVLIDDARTPLIISGPVPKGDDQMFEEYQPLVEKLVGVQRQLATQYLADAKTLISEGNKLVEAGNKKEGQEKLDAGFLSLYRSHKAMPKNKPLIKFLSEEGIKSGMQNTENIYMENNNRRMPECVEPLYFVVDEKLNSCDLTDKGTAWLANQVNDTELFVLPDITSELSALEAQTGLSDQERLDKKDEMLNHYAVQSERVHTLQQLLKAYCMFNRDDEYVVIDGEVKIVDEQTGRIMEGRRYSDGLHQAIEAKENVKVEAATQTYATITLQNYFRMYKKLAGMTGTAETEAGEFWNIYKLDVVVIPTNKPVIRDDANDLVYKTKREKYAAVVNEIIRLHEEGRPVLVGTTSVETSELLSRILTSRRIQHNVLNAKLHKKEADIVAEAGREGTVTIATNMAGRGTDIKLTPEVREKGGLAIIGTERHDSRRVDRQLRGRSGRQGDPGSSQFFVSLEDDLMRLFGSDRIAKVMDQMGHQDGDVIQHSMISKSIERAQKKVEENNFGIRKRLLEYDDVMNKQRSTIYRKRRNALFGDRLAIDIAQMFEDVCETVVTNNWEAKDFDGFNMDMIKTFGCESPFDEQYFLQERPHVLIEKLYPVVYDHYKTKLQQISEQAYPVMERVYLEHGDKFQNIAIPFTDGTKNINIVAPLKKCYETKGREVGLSFEKGITLAVIDNAWKEHLRAMDDLKESVQNASYEQKDPLLIYKLESFNLFDQLLVRISQEIVSFLNKGRIPMAEEAPQVREAQLPQSDAKKLTTGREEVAGGGRQVAPGGKGAQPIRVEKKVGRNDPCPCGSGKKYKNCHGRMSAE